MPWSRMAPTACQDPFRRGRTRMAPLECPARRDAVADARARAELYADAAGFTLGALLTLSRSRGYSQPMPMYDMRIEAAMPGVACRWQRVR